jgi:tetratricopeptide (TPR) repeat protein
MFWRRHVARLMGLARHAVLPVRLRVTGGQLFLNGPGAMAAAIEPRTGTVQWIRVPGRGQPQQEADARAWRNDHRNAASATARPVLTEAGLIVPRSASGSAPLLLDATSGRSIRPLSDEHWTGLSQFYAVGGDVLGIGERSVVRFYGKTLKVRWQHELAEPLEEMGLRPAITEQFVALPTEQGVTALSLSDGRVVMHRPMQATGHLLARRDQLLVAGRRTLHSYMGWAAAEPVLLRQIEAHPADPGPALSLAYLAKATGHHEALLNGTDHALAALDRLARGDMKRADQHRQAVFGALLDLAGQSERVPNAVRRRVFERIAQVADSPNQQIVYHLAVGRLLMSMNEARAAVEHYQTVLNQPRLAQQQYQVNDAPRRAGLEARSRLRQLIDRHGRAIYERFERKARARLEAVQRRGADVEALRKLAERYPFAQAATEARYQAALRLIEDGRSNEAVSELLWAYRRASHAPRRGRIVGRLTELYIDSGRMHRARQWLARVRRRHPDLKAPRSGEMVSLDQWLSELADAGAGRDGLASLDLPLGESRLAQGQVMTMASGAHQRARDRVLLRHNKQLQLYAAPGLEQQWTAALPVAGDWRLLRLDQEQVLLWHGEQDQILALDGQTGERLWPIQRTEALLRKVGQAPAMDAGAQAAERQILRGLQQQRRLQARQMPIRFIERLQRARRGQATLRVLSTPTVVIVVGQYGRMIGLAAHTGQVLWRAQAAMQRVSAAAASPRALAVAGVHGVDKDASQARLALLDPITGERLHPAIDQSHDQPPRWVGFAPERVIVAGAQTVQAYRLDDAQPAWSHSVGQQQLTGRGWASEHWLALVAVSTQVRGARSIELLDPANGQQRSQLSFDPAAGLSFLATDNHCHLASVERAQAVDRGGQVAWRDAVSLANKRLTAHGVTDRYALVLGHNATDAVKRQQLYFLQRQTGRLKQTYNLPSGFGNEPGHTLVPAAGGLAISSDQGTLIVPGRAAR